MNSVVRVFFCWCVGLLLISCDKEKRAIQCPITYGTLVDARDGSRYSTVSICSQTWMAQNLDFKIDGVLANPSNPDPEYGRLYNHAQTLNACPDGWHLPTDEEWKTLEIAIGMSSEEAEKIDWRGEKEGYFLKSTTEWQKDENGSNSAGFRALPAGGKQGDYLGLGHQAYFWTASTEGENEAWGRGLEGKQIKIKRFKAAKTTYYSCRCVMD